MSNNTQIAEELIVCRDNIIDDEYYELVWQRKRREAFKKSISALIPNVHLKLF